MFIMYTADVTRIVERHGLNVQQYADDIQLYGVRHPSNSASLCREKRRLYELRGQLDVR